MEEIKLSPQQRRVLELLAQGFTNKEIGVRIFTSPHTVRGYIEQLQAKLTARNRVQVVALAYQKGLL